MKHLAKGYVIEVKEQEDVIVGAVASTGSTDRDDEVLSPTGWDLENFKKAPRLLWAHDARQLPIGKITKISVNNKGALIFDAKFADKENAFAKQVKDLMKGGFLNTFSVGYKPLEIDGNKCLKQELLEISVVNVPANPDARTDNFDYKAFKESEMEYFKNLEMNKKDKEVQEEIAEIPKEVVKNVEENKENIQPIDEQIESEDKEIEEDIVGDTTENNQDIIVEEENVEEKSIEIKGVIPYSVHGDSPKAPEDDNWDGGVEVKKASGDAVKLKKMHAWIDSGAENFNADESKWYKLPHHKGDGTQAVVWKGVVVAMSALLGGRGGVDIPSEDRQGVYNHLKKHYAQFEKEVPELKTEEDKPKKDYCWNKTLHCGIKSISTKVEVTETLIRVPVGIECDVTATIKISEDEGISALYCGKEKKIRTYLFLRNKGWTKETAVAWVKEHSKYLNNIAFIVKDITGIKVDTVQANNRLLKALRIVDKALENVIVHVKKTNRKI